MVASVAESAGSLVIACIMGTSPFKAIRVELSRFYNLDDNLPAERSCIICTFDTCDTMDWMKPVLNSIGIGDTGRRALVDNAPRSTLVIQPITPPLFQLQDNLDVVLPS